MPPLTWRSQPSRWPPVILPLIPRHRLYATHAATSPSASDSSFNPGSSSSHDFPFPRSRHPTPFEIFHLPRTCSTAQVKARYYDLVKVYHPDKAVHLSNSAKGKGRANAEAANDEASRRFQLITDAYELLRHPTRRQMYLRTGEGWSQSFEALSAARHGRGPRRSWNSWADAETEIRRRQRAAGRPTWQRPFYRSAAWDWVKGHRPRSTDDSYGPWGDDFYTSNASADTGGWKDHWHHQGAIGKNGVVLSSVAGLSLLLYASQVWRVYGAQDSLTQMDQAYDDLSGRTTHVEPEGDARLDADAWQALSSPSPPSASSAPRVDKETKLRSSASIAPMYLSPLVKAAEERHRAASDNLRDARQAARQPWTLVDPRCGDVEGGANGSTVRRAAPGKKWGEMYDRMMAERAEDDGASRRIV